MDIHTKKVFMAVKSLFDGKRVVAICTSERRAEAFFRECVSLLMLSGARGEVTIRSGCACKAIVKGAGGIYVTALIPPGMKADVAILDDGPCAIKNLYAARRIVASRGGEVVI